MGGNGNLSWWPIIQDERRACSSQYPVGAPEREGWEAGKLPHCSLSSGSQCLPEGGWCQLAGGRTNYNISGVHHSPWPRDPGAVAQAPVGRIWPRRLFLDLDSHWTATDLNTDKLPGPNPAQVIRGSGNKGIITTVSVFPFSITFCSLVFPSDVPELCCYNEIKFSSLVTVATFQVLNSLMPMDTILDRTNIELLHHRKFCLSASNLDFQENLESRNFYSFGGRIKKGRNALTKYLVYTSLPLILTMCGRWG